MARLAHKRHTPDTPDANEPSTRRPTTARRLTPSRTVPVPSESPSPAVSFSSDKENRTATAAREARDRGKSGAGSSAGSSAAAVARRRGLGLEDRRPSAGSMPSPNGNAADGRPRREGSVRGETPARDPHSILDTRYYDPEQTLLERRPVRKGIRDLTRELQENRQEYFAADSTGIYDTIQKANEQFARIKQTSDATLDSNLMVKVSEHARRRAQQSHAQSAIKGLDAGEFAAQVAAFMRRGPTAPQLARLPADMQTAVDRSTGRRRLGDLNDDDDGAGPTQHDDGDELNWAWLGTWAAQPANRRPATPGFLLGPLSVQKKARAATQRTQRLAPQDPALATKPDEIHASQLERVENANLTALCRKIFKQLSRYETRARAAVEHAAQALPEDATEADVRALHDAQHLRDDGGVCLLHFAFDPRSFGQTVENLFYISFLVRDGKAGLVPDERGGLSLHAMDPAAAVTRRAGGKTQAVFHLDFATWRAVVREFGIEESIIPHRAEDGGREVGAGGWYA